ncbi:hypothetical protein C0993_012695 [Termitomyces sp. T159_Od127]|nr:hypothetical protein C0993_012695 [Termitomyces sp. T159_Od127]
MTVSTQPPRPGNGTKSSNVSSGDEYISTRGDAEIGGVGGLLDLKIKAGTGGNDACIATKRMEWRSIESLERVDYLRAVQCLQDKASKSGLAHARKRFDDFQAFHISVTHKVHGVGQFLPWHRWFLHVYEKTLRDECKYTGPIPYWDWTKDADPKSPEVFRSSPIFDPIYGFGNLPLVQGPLSSGAFAKYQLIFGVNGTDEHPNITSHLLERGFDDTWLTGLTKKTVESTLSQKTYEGFRIELEGAKVNIGPKTHNSGHSIVGGDMNDLHSSPGDPLFYLHHANLDRLWWKWQNKGEGNERLYEISGPLTRNDSSENVTLDTILLTGPFEERQVTIRQVMDIRKQPLCYTYVHVE